MAQISCSLECCIVLLLAGWGWSQPHHSVSVDKATLQQQGWKQGHMGSSKCLAENTEPVLFLCGGTVCADDSQTLVISISQGGKDNHIKKNRNSCT